jgi:hypothetical protein
VSRRASAGKAGGAPLSSSLSFRMALDTRPAADPAVAPPRRVGAWIILIAVVATGLALGARFGPQIVPYIAVEVAG